MNEIPRTADALVESVYQFNRIAGKTPPSHFDAERVGFYIGMQLEELAEQLHAVLQGTVSGHDPMTVMLKNLHDDVKAAGVEFKAGKFYGSVLRADRKELLDGAIDSVVVALGAAVYQTPKFRGAISCVLGANADKAPNGIATRDADGKVMKPEGWKKPDLTPFVDNYGVDL